MHLVIFISERNSPSQEPSQEEIDAQECSRLENYYEAQQPQAYFIRPRVGFMSNIFVLLTKYLLS